MPNPPMIFSTVCVLIGNSDDKLTQRSYASFCAAVESGIREYSIVIHFSGHSPSASEYQNACFVFVIYNNNIPSLKEFLIGVKNLYQQDSIAWIEGDTSFLR